MGLFSKPNKPSKTTVQIDSLKQELEAAKTQIQTSAQENQENYNNWTTHVSTLQNHLETNRQRSQAQIEALTNEKRQLQASHEELGIAKATLEVDFECQSFQLCEAKMRTAALEQQLNILPPDDARVRASQQDAKIRELMQQLRGKDDEIGSLKSGIERQREVINVLDRETQTQRRRTEELTAWAQKQESLVQEKVSIISDLTKQEGRHEIEIERIRDRHEKESQASRAEITTLQQNTKKKAQLLESLQMETAFLHDVLSQKEAQIRQLDAEVSRAQHTNREQVDKVKGLEQNVTRLNDGKNAIISEYEAEITELNKAINAIEDDHNEKMALQEANMSRLIEQQKAEQKSLLSAKAQELERQRTQQELRYDALLTLKQRELQRLKEQHDDAIRNTTQDIQAQHDAQIRETLHRATEEHQRNIKRLAKDYEQQRARGHALLEEKTKELESKQQALAKRTELITDLNRKLQAKSAEFREQGIALETKTRALEEAETKRQDARIEANEVKTKLGKAESKVRDLESEKESQQKMFEHTQQQCARLMRKNMALSQQQNGQRKVHELRGVLSQDAIATESRSRPVTFQFPTNMSDIVNVAAKRPLGPPRRGK